MSTVESYTEIPSDADPRKRKDPSQDGDESLIEVKREDTAEDSENEFVNYDEPFDEQMHDNDDDEFDEDAD